MKKMTVAEAAAIIGATPSFIRIGLQRGLLPFGSAVRYTENGKYTYHIVPVKVYEYMGLPVPDIYLP